MSKLHDEESASVSSNKDAAIVRELDNSSIDSDEDLLGIIIDDPILYRKQILVQKTLDEIGFTPFHWKLFCLNGFGYAADSLLVVCQSIAQPQVLLEFPSNSKLPPVSTASAVGLFVGAIVWGLGADAIGRKIAFNSSLFVSALFVLIAGAMPSLLSFCAMVAIYSAGAGGNYILDATNFFEFCPRSHAFLTTIMAFWWGVGYTITGLLAWAFMSNFSCETAETCTYKNNSGWRYLHYTSGGLILLAAIARVTVIKLPHTPKWFITQGRDEEAYELLRSIAQKNNRPFSLELEQLKSIGEIDQHEAQARFNWRRSLKHFNGLFATRKMVYTTLLLFLLWILIGLGDPLYSVFRPYYLKTRGYTDDTPASNYIVWRNYAIGNITGLVGPFLAWPLLNTKYIGRKGTLAIGALSTMAFLFGYTQVKNGVQNEALSFVISAVENIFFGALYGVTPELLPTGSRATGYGLSVAINRVCNVMANVIAGYANVETTAPLFICAALFGAMAIVSMLLPFDPHNKYIA